MGKKQIEFKLVEMLGDGFDEYAIVIDGVVTADTRTCRFCDYYSPFRGWVKDDDPEEVFTAWGREYDPEFEYREAAVHES